MADYQKHKDLSEQAALDIEAVITFFVGISDHFRIELDIDDNSISGIVFIAGYLRECARQGKPDEIMVCLKECYERLLRAKFMGSYFWRCINSAEIVN